MDIVFSLAVTVNFSQSVYNINEGTKLAQIEVVLSNPSSYEIFFPIRNFDVSATSEGIHLQKVHTF